ncbi:hypothetical protein [Streptomyces sp. NPDC059881]|uniref:hypothetical protein n=1 Tax=Streptomyces sp. NPDC059881 TaxID=3346986 RepID=UPI003667D5D0
MHACGCMDLGEVAWRLAGQGVLGVLLLAAAAVVLMCLTAGAMALVLRAVGRRRGAVEPAGQPASLGDFRWEEEPEERVEREERVWPEGRGRREERSRP